MARNNVYTSFKVEEIRRNSEKAYLVAVRVKQGQPVDVAWLPKSQIQSVEILQDGTGNCIFMCSEWILGEKGWLSVAAAQKVPVSASIDTAPKSEYPDIPF